MRSFILFFISLFLCISCVKDAETVRKERMLVIYGKMNNALIKKNIKWFEKNFYNAMPEYINENYLFENEKSIRNFVNENKENEYSVTFRYKTLGLQYLESGNESYIVVRRKSLEPNYYYIGLIYDKKKKDWRISDIIMLPLEKK